jgi:hypothetical protein
MQAAAFELFDRREQLVHRECSKRASAFFKDAADVHDDEFWTRRADSADRAAAAAGGDPSSQDLTPDVSARRAFERLRDEPDLRLMPASDFRFDKAADIEGREVVMRDAIRIPGIAVPVRFAAGINLPELIRASGEGHNVPATVEGYQRRIGPIDPNAVLTGLSILVAKGVLLLARGSPRRILPSPPL